MRYDTRAIAVVAVAALTVLAVPDGALADHSTAILPFGGGGSSITVAGCQAKGLRVIEAQKSSGSGLAAATYLYTVSAVLAGGETPACLPLAVTTTASNDSAVLQWNAAPGAVGYRVYRSDSTASPATLRALVFGPNNTVLPPNTSCPAVGRADKCVFQDNGSPQDVSKFPTLIAPTSQGGAHADVNLVQTIDYGSDTFASDPASTTASLRSDVFHLPPGFMLSPNAAPTCKLAGAAPSLIGDPAKFGRDDPDEDTCLNSTLVGTIQTRAVTASNPSASDPSVTEGDIYNGETQADELARLFIVLRPPCSAGNLVASPGSTTCNTSLGGTNHEVEKSFLAGVARMVDHGGGVLGLGLDIDTVEAETGGPIAPYLNILVPSPTALARVGKLRLSLRRLSPRLFGVADEGTESTADDQPFMTLPIYCGVQSLSGEITTYTDTTPATGSTPIAVSSCVEPPPPPAPPGTTPPPPGTTPQPPGGGETLPAFGTKTLVTLRLAARRIPARGPLKVRVANANGFGITGALSGRTVNRVSVSLLRRIILKTKAFSVAARSSKTVKLALPRSLRRLLAREHKLTLRLTAKLKDPAGNTRTVRARVSPLLRR